MLLVLSVAEPGYAAKVDKQWNCSADASGNWSCDTAPISGAPYARPSHPVAPPPKSEEPGLGEVRNLDWMDESLMTPEQRAALPSSCCGAYVEPARDYEDANLDPENAPLRINANTTDAQEDGIAVLTGDVQISQGYRQIRSDRARIDQKNRRVELSGDVQFREPGVLFLGSDAKVDIDSLEVDINNATFVLHENSARGTAKKLERAKNGIITIEDARYTTCQPGEDTWQLVTGDIEIDQETGFATVRNARVEVKDYSVFYFPWVKFPISDKRSTGLLFPIISHSGSDGLDFAQPIYFNLAPNYDATFVPRYIEKRGLGGALEFRHLSRYTDTVAGVGFQFDDQGGDIDPATGKREYEGDDRYLTTLQHEGGVGYRWSTAVDYNKVSDRDYLHDFGNLTLEVNSRSYLNQTASAGYRTDHWNYSIQAEDYQLITKNLPEPYYVLPRLNANGYYRFNDTDLVLVLNNQYTTFEHRDAGNVTGGRTRLDYGLTWDKRWSWGYFRPRLSMEYIAYQLDDNGATVPDDNPSVAVPVQSVDMGIYFERHSDWFGGFIQTLEPRLFYLNADFKDQTHLPDFDTREFTPSYDLLFRDNRFIGGDRIADDERVTFGITSRFINSRTGQERFRIGVAQAFHQKDRFVTSKACDIHAFDQTVEEYQLCLAEQSVALDELKRNQSPLAVDMAARIATNWRVTSELIYDTFDDQIEKSNFGVRFNDRQNRIFNLTYRYTRELPRTVFDTTINQDILLDQDIDQLDVSGFLPISKNYNLVARWNHDLTNNRELEQFFGFEYNSCCWRASLVGRRWIGRDDEEPIPERNLGTKNGIFFQIQFKGLAGTGKKVDSILEDGIFGYETPRDY